MGIIADFFDRLFGSSGEPVSVDVKTWRNDSKNGLMLEAYSMFTAVEMLANLMADCEIKTFRNGREEKGKVWYQLNYAPNRNQTATEFWREFYGKLLYEGEALCVELDDQIIIADSWTVDDMQISERTFANVTRGNFEAYGRFKISDVIYIKYDNKTASALRNGLLSRLSALAASAADEYEQSGGSKVLLNVPSAARNMPNFEKDFEDLMNNRFKSFFKNKNAVIPLWNGMQAAFHNDGGAADKRVDDLKKLTLEALTRAGLAYKIAPALLTGEVAGLKEALNFTLTAAVDPTANVVSEQLTVKYYEPEEVINNRSYAVVDTTNIKHIDVFEIASNVEKLISSGFMSIDEVRASAGMELTGEEWAQKHYITKNFEEIEMKETENGEGGETI